MSEHNETEQAAIYEQLNALLDGELAPELRAQLEAHLAECPSCHAFFESLQATLSLYHQLDAHNLALPSEVEARLRQLMMEKKGCKR
jgi:anti-sigma factor RsiW